MTIAVTPRQVGTITGAPTCRGAAATGAGTPGDDNDVLEGGWGNDRLRGGADFDRCAGGPGRNSIRGCER